MTSEILGDGASSRVAFDVSSKTSRSPCARWNALSGETPRHHTHFLGVLPVASIGRLFGLSYLFLLYLPFSRISK